MGCTTKTSTAFDEACITLLILESFCHLGILHNKGSDSEIVAHLCNRMPYVSFCYVVTILFFLSLDLAA